MERGRGEPRHEAEPREERIEALEKTEAFYGRLTERARQSPVAKGLVGLLSLMTVEGCTVAGYRVEPAMATGYDPETGRGNVSAVLQVQEVRQRSYTEIVERMEEPERELRAEGDLAPCQGQTCMVMREKVAGVSFVPMEVTKETGPEERPKIAAESLAPLKPAGERAVARARATLVWQDADYRIAERPVSFDIDPRSMKMAKVKVGERYFMVVTPKDKKAFEAVYFVPLEDRPESEEPAQDVPHF